jgi:hypothetical protein
MPKTMAMLMKLFSTGAKKTRHLLPKYQSSQGVLLMGKIIKKHCKM